MSVTNPTIGPPTIAIARVRRNIMTQPAAVIMILIIFNSSMVLEGSSGTLFIVAFGMVLLLLSGFPA
jgi:hypothetical protein